MLINHDRSLSAVSQILHLKAVWRSILMYQEVRREAQRLEREEVLSQFANRSRNSITLEDIEAPSYVLICSVCCI